MIVGPYHTGPQEAEELDEATAENLRIQREYGYSPFLAKACHDPFDYALMLRSGIVYRFTEASPISKEWVHISGIPDAMHMHSVTPVDMTFERGMDIRVSEIAWVADAPNGS